MADRTVHATFPSMSDGLLSDEELDELIREAEAIEREPKPQYAYRDPNHRGGPRNIPEEDKMKCAEELSALRFIYDSYESRAEAAKLLLYTRIETWLEAGMPLDLVAESSGLKYRASVLKAVRQTLPRLRERRARQLDTR